MTGNSTPNARATWEKDALPPEEVIFGCTPALQAVRQHLEKICGANLPVLIQGSPGSGKEILARWIHHRSPWASGPFVKVNFAAIPGSLLESELFGYEAGAFTGANSSRIGRVELAQGGTLFLDQITDLDGSFQAKLLQLLQDGRFTRLGGQEERRIETRIICATCQRLEDAVRAGFFRQDLYYRVNVFEVDMPALASRRQDIPAISKYLLEHLAARFQKQPPQLQDGTVRFLRNKDWPGNIREMENWISRYVLLGEEELPQLNFETKDSAMVAASEDAIPLKRIVRQAGKAVSRELILGALQANRWNRRKAAKDLKISYRTLLYEIREIGIPSKSLQKRASQTAESPNSSPRAAE